jgi:RNA polymerase sigma-70 factor (ECF subfamily)
MRDESEGSSAALFILPPSSFILSRFLLSRFRLPPSSFILSQECFSPVGFRAEQTDPALCPEYLSRGDGLPAEALAKAGPPSDDRSSGEDPRIVDWVRRAQAGESDAFEALVLHFQDRVWRRALYRLGDWEEAHDLAQDVFILCFRKLHQFRGESKFWTWLCRVVDNQVKNRKSWLQRRGQGKTFSLDAPSRSGDEDLPKWDPPDEGPSPRKQAEARQELDALNRCLDELGEDHREVLLMRHADGLAYEEIAETLEISLGTVKSRINRARKALADLMEGFRK